MPYRILVVEDSPTQAAALCALLEEHDHAVEHAASGEAALQKFDCDRFDLVLTDVVMSGMSGYDLCRRIKEQEDCDIPVVLVTSLADPLDIVRGLECGADNYVTKPYDEEQLLARVRNVIDRPKLRRNVRASMGVKVSFLGKNFSITAEKEQILDLFISSVEDVVRTNHALRQSQIELARAQEQLEIYADRMAQQARLSTEKYSTLMAHAGEGIIVLDRAAAILDANVRAGDLLGRPPESLRGQSLEDFVSPEHRDRMRAALRELDSGLHTDASELGFVHISGRRTWCDFAASRTKIGDEELVLVILHDVGERVRSAEALRRNNERLQLALDAAQMGTLEWDVSTGEVVWSAASTLAFGPTSGTAHWTFDDFMGGVHEDDRERLRSAFVRAARSGTPYEVEFRLAGTSREPRWLHAKGRGIAEDDGRIGRVAGVVLDITARHRLEAQLQQAQKMEAVGLLAGGVAHDFNNLLTAILSYSEMMIAEVRPDDPMRADLQEIKGAADRAALLTRQLLAFSRQQVLQPRVLELNAVISEIEKLLRRLIPESIEVRTLLGGDLWNIHADPGQLEQVLVNLAVNARDAMPEGGTITIETANAPLAGEYSERHANIPPGNYVMLAVSDTGHGMDQATQARIFEPFFTTKEKGRGTGLGLSTIYGIVRQSGGYIWVYSAVGVGTTFKIYFPCVDRAAEAAERQPRAGVASGSETILLVEDDVALRAVARRILRKAGYAVIEAKNGREALELIRDPGTVFDLVVSDVDMPEMGGPALAREIRRNHPRAGVLLMSGYTADAAMRANLLAADTAFLEKPFTPERLAGKVREVLDARSEVTA